MAAKSKSAAKSEDKNSSELQAQIRLGRDYLKTKQYDRAETIFLNILRKMQLADVYNSLGLVYADQGKFNFAEIAFQKALQINPNYMEAALNLSVVYNNLGLGKKSKAIYEKLQKYGAKSRGAMDAMLMARVANMHAEIGDLYHGVGEYQAAIEEFEKAVDLCPWYIDVQTKLATCYREHGKADRALKIFTKHKSKASRYAPFWIALGVTYYARDKRQDAKKAWAKALKIDSKNKTAQAYAKLIS